MAKEVATASESKQEVEVFDDDFLREAEEYGGAGRTEAMEDNVLPFLSLLQDMSPEVKKRDPDYIEGAEPGMILNKATKKLYTELTVIPVATDRRINQWTPRDAGGGFRGSHPIRGDIDESMIAAGGSEKPDPQDPNKTQWVLPNGDQLIDTRYVYVLVLDGNSAMPAVISFSSTGHTVAKAWSSLRNSSKLPNGAKHPIWFRKYTMKTKPAKNNKGDFFVLDFLDLGDEGWVKDKSLREAGRDIYEQFQKGEIRNEDDVDAGTKTEGNATDVI